MDFLDSILGLVHQTTGIPPEQTRALEKQVRALHGGNLVYVRKNAEMARNGMQRQVMLQEQIAEALRAGVPIRQIPQDLGCSRRVVYKHMGKVQRRPA